MEKQLRRSTRNTISADSAPISNEKVPSLVVEPVETEENNSDQSHLSSPLHNPLILNHIFNQLEFNDLKQCHLVCSIWNQLCIPLLEKRGKVTLAVGLEHSPETFKEFSKDSNIHFRAFRLAKWQTYSKKWSAQIIIDFLQDRRETMEELIIDNVPYVGEEYRFPSSFENYFDISPHIGNQLTHLTIFNNTGSNFLVDTNKLTSLKSISLDHCGLGISEGCVLSPQKFELNNATLFKNGQIVHDVLLINELLDFETLKDLSLEGSSIQLDLNGKVTLNNLSLKHLSLLNFRDSQWEIKGKLQLCCVSFDERTRMKFTELHFRHKSINLDLLPESLEKLTLSEIGYCDEPLTIVASSVFSRENLKYFQLLTKYNRFFIPDVEESEDDDDSNDEDPYDYDPTANPLRYLNYFAQCPNLTTVRVKLQEFVRSDVCQRLHTEWIPKSTENLFLSGNVRVTGKEFECNKIVIENNLHFLTSTLKRLKSKHIVLDLNSESVGLCLHLSKLKLEKILVKLIQRTPYETLAIGSLDEMGKTFPEFNQTSFSNDGVERTGYYFFTNQDGKPIKEWEFKKMLEK